MKTCPYCGSEVKENQLFCGNCGAKLEKETLDAEEPVESIPNEEEAPTSDSRIPHWCQKMFAIMGMCMAFAGGIGGIVIGSIGLKLGGRSSEYRGIYIASIVIGAIVVALLPSVDIFLSIATAI